MKGWRFVVGPLVCIVFGTVVPLAFAGGQGDGGGKPVGGAAVGFHETGLPIVDKPVSYKMAVLRRATHGPFDEMQFFKQLEEKTGVHIVWNMIPEAQFIEKKNLILASNDLPDAFFGWRTLSSDDLVTYSTQKMLIPLDDLIEKYAPNLKAILNEKPDLKALITAPDGKIYSMPFANEVGVAHIPDNLFIYKPWLDKLGLKIPSTIDEFYSTLKAFKERDPNGNGKADEVPFTFIFGDVMRDVGSLFGALGRVDNIGSRGTTVQHLLVDNGKVIFTADKPEYKEAIRYFHRYFAEGLMDSEGFTQDFKQWAAKGKNEVVTYGSFISWNYFDFDPIHAKDYVVVPPLIGVNGKRLWNWIPFDNIKPTGFSITAKASNPEVLVRWADQFYEKGTSVEALLGPVGINLTKKSDGTYDFLPTPKDMGYGEFRYKNTPGDAPLTVFAEDFGKIVPRQQTAQKKYDDILKYYKPYATDIMYPTGFMFSVEDTKRVKILSTDIFKYVDEMRARWLMNGGVEAHWDEYVAKLKAMGVDEFVQIHQRNYDRLFKKK